MSMYLAHSVKHSNSSRIQGAKVCLAKPALPPLRCLNSDIVETGSNREVSKGAE